MTAKKRAWHDWPVWFGVGILYVLSWGPVFWLSTHLKMISEFEPILIVGYFPVAMVYEYGPPRIKEGMRWYLNLGAKKD